MDIVDSSDMICDQVDQDYISGVVEGFYGQPWTAEQRRHLFKNLKKLGMNTYLYAPKNDLKHRAKWRILYTPEETELLKYLINSAKESNVTFVYALSPGIDIVYSNKKEVDAIQDKFKQVHLLGCESFALLFDDIEPSMNEEDRKQFLTFVEAQVTVSNTVYKNLNSPSFMFCPTEYCESRAVPSLDNSEYLKTIGEKLDINIKILWTGPRIVSRYLTIEHVRRVSKILKRKPLIWDNLFANDYDPKRIFLGPFFGRSVRLKNEIAGLLLNPNTKYEANFIPLFTYAEWNRSEDDMPRNDNNFNSNDSSLNETEKTRFYDPINSLEKAIDNWIFCYFQNSGPTLPPMSQMETQTIATIIDPSVVNCSSVVVPLQSIRTCEGNEMVHNIEYPQPLYTSPIGNATTVTVQTFPISETIISVSESHESIIPQAVNSLTTDYNKPIETLSTISKDKNQSTGAMEIITENSDFLIDECVNPLTENASNAVKWLRTFVDIFYLPFDFGQRGIKFLQEFQWLHENAYTIRLEYSSENKNKSIEWLSRYDSFTEQVFELNCFYRFIIDSPNNSLVQEIFSYVWEAQDILSVLSAILSWMREGNLVITPKETGNWWDRCACDDLEPWALGGGLLSDLQKLIVTSPQLADFFTIKSIFPSSYTSSYASIYTTCYTIHPILNEQSLNKQVLYEFYSTDEEREYINAIIGKKYAEEMFFDKFFLPLLKYGVPAHHFIAEEFNNSKTNLENGNNKNQVFAIALTIFNLENILDNFKNEFIPQYRAKFSAIIDADSSISDEQKKQQKELLEVDIEHWNILNVPKKIIKKYSSYLEIRWKNYTNEAFAVRRVLYSVSTTLALNGSTGFFTLVKLSCAEKTKLLQCLGLINVLNDKTLYDRKNPSLISNELIDDDKKNDGDLFLVYSILGHEV